MEGSCLNIVAANSAQLISSEKNSILGMDSSIITKIVEKSLCFLRDEDHLNNLINLLFEAQISKDIFELTSTISRKYLNAGNYNFQDIDVKMVTKLNPREDREVPELFVNSKPKTTDSINEIKKENECKIEEYSLPSPNKNILIMPIEDDINNYSIALEIAIANPSDTSLISKAFNTNSRSWVVKIDVTAEGSISLFIIERGALLDEENTKYVNYSRHGMNLDYTSALVLFRIKDQTFDKCNNIFFSFSHDHNQVIGINNFAHLKDLFTKDKINIYVKVIEIGLHSACLKYISDRFDSYCILEIENKPPINTNLKKSLFDLHPFDIRFLLLSNTIKIGSEKLIHKFISLYAGRNSTYKLSEIDALIDGLRFQYIDIGLLFSTIRDNKILNKSMAYKMKFQEEYDRRIQKLEAKDHSRKYAKDKIENSTNVSNEIVNWLCNSNHHKGYEFRINQIEKELLDLKKEKKDDSAIIDQLKTEKDRLKNELYNKEKFLVDNKLVNQQQPCQMSAVNPQLPLTGNKESIGGVVTKQVKENIFNEIVQKKNESSNRPDMNLSMYRNLQLSKPQKDQSKKCLIF